MRKKEVITMDITLTNNYYWNLLKDLSDERKVDLINRLAHSLIHKNEKEVHVTISPDQISDAWCEDGLSAEEEIRQIRESRQQGITRKIVDL